MDGLYRVRFHGLERLTASQAVQAQAFHDALIGWLAAR